MFNVSDSLGIKLLTRLHLGLSHFREHKFSHNFHDIINPPYSCCLESESTIHFFLHYQNFMDLCKCLINELIKIDSCVFTLDKKAFTKLLLYGDGRYDWKANRSNILASMKFVYSSKHFNEQLMWLKKQNTCLRYSNSSVYLIILTNQIMRSRVSTIVTYLVKTNLGGTL